MGVLADCARCVQETVKAFGGIDIIIGNAMSSFQSLFDLFGNLEYSVLLKSHKFCLAQGPHPPFLTHPPL